MDRAQQRNHGRMLREVVAYGARELRMTDAAMARDLAISRERVRQLRGQGIPRRACPQCGGRTQGEREICAKCHRRSPQGRAENAAAVRKHYLEKAHATLRPLLEACENLAEGVRFNHPDEWERDNLAPLLSQIRRALGKEP